MGVALKGLGFRALHVESRNLSRAFAGRCSDLLELAGTQIYSLLVKTEHKIQAQKVQSSPFEQTCVRAFVRFLARGS